VQRSFGRFLLGRLVQSLLFVLIVSSSAFLLIHLAPGDHLSEIGADPAIAAAERHRLGLDRPVAVQYAEWLWRAVRLDLGTSLKYQRPVASLVLDRTAHTMILGFFALLLATSGGLVVGTLAGAMRGGPVLRAVTRVLSVTLLSIPPLVTSFALLLLAAVTGWFPVGGFPQTSAPTVGDFARYLLIPTGALGLPLAASLERLQASAIRSALAEPSIHAARARGLSAGRVLWRHALRLSLPSVLSIYGIIVASVLSGSFAVEIAMSWPGLGALTYEALGARDLYLVAGCAIAVSTLLAAGVLASDVALRLADPRRESW
jgi:ABC-type dipeptide/oligopeptide/nickel transport system permease component